MEYTFSEKDGYLLVTITGSYTLDDSKRLAQRVRSECEERKMDHVVMNFKGFKGPIPGPDRFAIGDLLAKIWGDRSEYEWIMWIGCYGRYAPISNCTPAFINPSRTICSFASVKKNLKSDSVK